MIAVASDSKRFIIFNIKRKKHTEGGAFRVLFWSRWQDSNLRLLRPERSALPNWATSRYISNILYHIGKGLSIDFFKKIGILSSCSPLLRQKILDFGGFLLYNIKVHLPVAQLDSASDSDSEGRRFESYRVGQKSTSFDRSLSIFTSSLLTLHFSLFSYETCRLGNR